MPIIEACVDGSEFWSNKIRMQYRGKDDNQIGFCNHFKTFLTQLMAYVKEHHTTGVTWNPRGIDASAYKKDDAAATPAPTTAPTTAATASPAAAPAPAPVVKAATAPVAAAPGGDLFAELRSVRARYVTMRIQ